MFGTHAPFLLLLLAYCHASYLSSQSKDDHQVNGDQKQTLRMQMAKILDINPSKSSKPASRSNNAASRYMQKLYFKHSQNPGPHEGSTVRSISPQLITSELENVDDMSQIVFNLGAINRDERILRAELHFNQRIHRRNLLTASMADFYKAKAWCSTCRPNTMLQLDRTPTHNRQWATFLATDLVDDAISNNQSQFKVQFSRRDFPILAPKAIKIHTPFLLVFTQQPSDSTPNEQPSSSASKRSKRSTDNSYYYQYLPVDDSNEQQNKEGNPITNTDLNSDAVWRSNFEKFRDAGPKVLKERAPKKNKRTRNDPMMGFGKVNDDEPERNRANKKSQQTNNELTVFLLDNEQKGNKQCGKRPFVVNFREIGWDDWIIAPKKFEAHYCAGSCEFPLAQNTNPSNHAQLQSIAHSMGLLPPTATVCCAPDRMDSQTLLYYDESGNVVLKNYPKMTVSSCSCV